jgi:triosephosphate isomerase
MPQVAKTREFLIVANWKMNKTIREAVGYIEKLPELVQGLTIPLWFAVPFTAIRSVREGLPKEFHVGAQNMNDATSGAFTGEIAAVMITEAGGDFVILGHSERRQYFHESDEFINKKVKRALESSLRPILCIGEGYDQREAGETEAVLKKQLEEGFSGVSSDQIASCIIAYEPIWAIGTGKTATPDLVQQTHATIRSVLAAQFNDDVAAKIPILYGGSVSLSSAEALTTTEGVDGFLIGTASLDPETFAKITRISENARSGSAPTGSEPAVEE